MSEETPDDKLSPELIQVMEDINEMLDQRLESNDVIIASLMSAFIELSSAVETIATKIMEPSSEEEKAAFRSEIRKRHHEQLKMMEKVGREVERSNTNDPSAAVLRMAREHAADPERESDSYTSVAERSATKDGSDG